jgi:hypothetical protein
MIIIKWYISSYSYKSKEILEIKFLDIELEKKNRDKITW